MRLTSGWTNEDVMRSYHFPSAYMNWKLQLRAGRRLLGTAKGYMRLAPPAAHECDILCVLLGSSVLLRKAEPYYILVGECFVLAFIDGEALQDIDERNAVLQ